MQSPRVPWEVIERIIDHSRDQLTSLRSFSLTCSQLHPRSRCRMLAAGVHLKSGDHVFALVDFLQDNPHFKPFVTSIIVRPTDLAPFPLLHILSNLSEIAFTTARELQVHPVPSLHPSRLTCFQRFGRNVQTLRLLSISFSTPLALAQLLLAFSGITRLICTDVAIQNQGNEGPLAVVKRRLSEKLQLKSLADPSFEQIDIKSLEGGHPSAVAAVGDVLFDSDITLVSSTVESFRLIGDISTVVGIRLFEWPRLESLTLQFRYDRRMIANAVQLLEDINDTVCKDVRIQFDPESSIEDVTNDLGSLIHTMLERALMKIARVGITWTVQRPLHRGRSSFWTRELEKHFPALTQRGTPLVLHSEANDLPSSGHDDSISAITVSKDSKWAASASPDATVVLWNAQDGRVAQEWSLPDYRAAHSIAFSPDTRILVCGGADGNATIWELWNTARIVSTLEGHTHTISGCVWSPDGTVIATASFDATVRLWDASTFQVLHVLRGGPKGFRYNHRVTFSSNGRWLASACSSENDFCIWDVVEGTLRKAIRHDTPDLGGGGQGRLIIAVAAVFDLGNSRIATTVSHSQVEICDIETGERSFVSERVDQINTVSFSPDERLVAAALQNGTVKVWDVNAGVELFELGGHGRAVKAAHFSPCGEYIAAAAVDCETVVLWRVSDGTRVAEFSEDEGWVSHIAFSPDGTTLCTALVSGTVVIRRMVDIIRDQ